MTTAPMLPERRSGAPYERYAPSSCDAEVAILYKLRRLQVLEKVSGVTSRQLQYCHTLTVANNCAGISALPVTRCFKATCCQ